MRRADHTILTMVLLLLVACQGGGELPTAVPTAAAIPTATDVPATAVIPTDTAIPVQPTATSAAEPTVGPTAVVQTPTATPGPAAAFCPEVPRPALLLWVPGEKYVIADPASGGSCDLPLPGPVPGNVQAAGEHIYYHAAEGSDLVVRRISPDGADELLPYTALDTANGLFQSFLISPDGRFVAWGYAGTSPDDPSTTMSELWVAETASGQVTAHLGDAGQAGEGPHALQPVRFSDDGATLFYARQPVGIGGAWMAFVGRYDTLASVPTSGGEITEHFNCADQGLFLCIGDFYLVNGQLANLVYTDDQQKQVLVLTGDGRVINTLTVEGNYVGYPTFSPSAELVFYSAELSEQSILPMSANLHRVAPPTAPAETVIGDPAILLPNRFLDGTRLVVGYAPDESSFGNALVDLLDGSLVPLSQWPIATVVAVLP